ncbi:MAG: VCBS repeat-containing protein [Deltaproteobacteria bacterium]|nr:VCBS repeat-containing protein [Deltaproteobacteria bacterium]
MSTWLIRTGVLLMLLIARPLAAQDGGSDAGLVSDAAAASDASVSDAASAAAPQLISGWPVEFAAGTAGGYLFSPRQGAAIADLDGDKQLEVIRAAGDALWVWDANAKPRAGFPVKIGAVGQAAPTVGDLDGDGKLEIVQVTRGARFSDPSEVIAVDHTGKPLPSWPVHLFNLVFQPASVVDLDGDGKDEVLVQSAIWPDKGTLFAYNHLGKPFSRHWPQNVQGLPVSPLAVGDLDDDGRIEIGLLTGERVYLFDAEGQLKPGFPINAADKRKFRGGIVAAQLDPARQQRALLWLSAADLTEGGEIALHAVWSDGKPVSGFPASTTLASTPQAPPVVGDVDGDGKLEIVITAQVPGRVLILDTAGKILQTISTTASVSAEPTLVDVDGDGDLELLVDNNTLEQDAGFLEGYHHDGKPLAGFPIRTRGTTLSNSATVDDIDGDGILELAIGTIALGEAKAWLELWKLPKAQRHPMDWPTTSGNVRRSGCIDCATAPKTPWKADGGTPDAAPADAGVAADAASTNRDASADAGGQSGGGGCSLASASLATGGLWWLLLGLAVLPLLRRRRSPADAGSSL